jgi:hypothetical protein
LVFLSVVCKMCHYFLRVVVMILACIVVSVMMKTCVLKICLSRAGSVDMARPPE